MLTRLEEFLKREDISKDVRYTGYRYLSQVKLELNFYNSSMCSHESRPDTHKDRDYFCESMRLRSSAAAGDFSQASMAQSRELNKEVRSIVEDLSQRLFNYSLVVRYPNYQEDRDERFEAEEALKDLELQGVPTEEQEELDPRDVEDIADYVARALVEEDNPEYL